MRLIGYTHYWKFKQPLSEKALKKIKSDIELIELYLDGNPTISENADGCYDDIVELFDGNGDKKTVEYVYEPQDGKKKLKYISFNGDDSKGLSHETFYLNVGQTREYCKTYRKPYDLAVTLALLTVKYHLKSTVVESDGDNDEWEHAYRLFHVIFPNRGMKFELLDPKGSGIAKLQMLKKEEEPKTKEYTVTWEIQVSAIDPVEAAKEALAIMQDKESEALAFEVTTLSGEAEETFVDLLEE